eukprot:scaffold15512_cov90-Skeletonema_dohrnii-CCMP3373.AAC.1
MYTALEDDCQRCNREIKIRWNLDEACLATLLSMQLFLSAQSKLEQYQSQNQKKEDRLTLPAL